MRRNRLIQDLAASVSDPPESEIQNYYRSHMDEFSYDERVRVRQILLNDEAEARKVVDALRKGTSFEELSAEHSLAPNAKNGGDIGHVARGQLPKIFEEAIFGLEPGATSGIVKTDNNFHIFRVDGRQPPGVASYDSAAPMIRAKLRADALDAALARTLADARRLLPIRILVRRLPFPYSGTHPVSRDE
jgi:parvulin-like peptidyl-prolyl isomerase